jgi:hypothetical protein
VGSVVLLELGAALLVAAQWGSGPAQAPSAGQNPSTDKPLSEGDPSKGESGSEKAPTAAEQLAARAHCVLRTYCHRCHGEGGAAEGGMNFVLDLQKLVARKRIIPGNAEKSRLYRRVQRGEMPPE